MKPFFTILTRTMLNRTELFARCKRSVDAQSFQDFEHLILLDDKGVGVAEAQRMLHTAAPRGQYVLVLDDDDFLSGPDVLAQLHAALDWGRPIFAVVKVQHGLLGLMPMRWAERPRMGEITVSNVVVEHEHWYMHRTHFGAHYAGDFDFIDSLFLAHPDPQWVDVDLVTVEMMRNGRADPSPAQIEAMTA